MNAGKKKAAMLFFNNIYPLPGGKWLNVLKRAKRSVCVESNATGQFARLVRAETGFSFDKQILRYDGRPLSVPYVMEGLNG